MQSASMAIGEVPVRRPLRRLWAEAPARTDDGADFPSAALRGGGALRCGVGAV